MINWQRVNELKGDIGAEDIGEVIDIFLEEVEEVINRLRSGTDAALEQDMHFLKGSALNLGFDRFGAMCSDAEKAVAKGGNGSLSLDGILEAYNRSKTEFLRGIASG